MTARCVVCTSAVVVGMHAYVGWYVRTAMDGWPRISNLKKKTKNQSHISWCGPLVTRSNKFARDKIPSSSEHCCSRSCTHT